MNEKAKILDWKHTISGRLEKIKILPAVNSKLARSGIEKLKFLKWKH